MAITLAIPSPSDIVSASLSACSIQASCSIAFLDRPCGRDAGIRGVSIHCIRRTVSSMLNTVLPQKAVADMLGHSERVNEQHYNYSMAENAEKKRSLEEVFSKVLKFEEFSSEKKTAINA